MDKHLHIIAFDVPYPANYGGVIDVFYKVKALAQLGVKVHLHCFEYGRKGAVELNAICESVHYYKRRINKGFLFRRKPYIVVTRASKELMQRLLRDNYPILFEGLHSCLYLEDERLVKRFKIVRTHNIEHDYYSNLAQAEKDFFKKYYFLNEVGKLQRFERTLCNAQAVAAISKNDTAYLNGKYSGVQHISAFHPNDKVEIATGVGNFCLYHGSLDVGENDQAAQYLIRKVFSQLDIPLIIAGNRPSKELKREAAKHSHIEIRTGVDTEEIHRLIREAQINVLPTFQATGIKLKLLAALYMGRHCVVNSPMVKNTGLEFLCRVEDNEKRMAEAIKALFTKELNHVEAKKREAILASQFSNEITANKLYEMIFLEKAPELALDSHLLRAR
ncbi:MAG: glycosyltransferase [Flavobacteriales bacterium]|nr:glycosyltransferase [Flavobacteriales bacterium]